ncbi:MAG: DUF6544 family protein, partial [Dehalococcoidia bacterium]
MAKDTFLDKLWQSAPAGERNFRPDDVTHLPEAVKLYLEHAIAPGTELSSAVWLRMHGEIKLKRWVLFKAEQVINRGRGMVWSASVRMYGIPVRGFDRLVDGEGEMRWKLLGLIPIIRASGPDITRSVAGRVAAELIWLPSMLCDREVEWEAEDASHARALISISGHASNIRLTVRNSGRLDSISVQRWGNPGGAEFHLADFGGVVEQEDPFSGYTVPSRLRVGWYFGTDKFEEEGEFFRVTIHEATFR